MAEADDRAWFVVMDVVAREFERRVRDSLAGTCVQCQHQITEPFIGCGIGRQKMFKAGGRDCDRFALQSCSIEERDGEE